MTVADVAHVAIDRILGRLARRLLAWLLVAVAVLAAIYHATVAVSAALELEFGVIYAHLIIAAFYGVAVIIIAAILWLTVRRGLLASDRASILRLPPELQIAAIVEAMLLGFAMSRRN